MVDVDVEETPEEVREGVDEVEPGTPIVVANDTIREPPPK